MNRRYAFSTARSARRLSALLALLLVACSRDPQSPSSPPSDPAPAPPPGDLAAFGDVIFETYYINFAWGFQLQGRYIDRDGVIWQYVYDGEAWMPRTTVDGRLLGSSLELKHRDAHQVGQVDLETLARMAARLEDAAAGELTRREAGADMGATSHVGYLYDAEADAYTEVTLRSRGDWDVDNSSGAAQALVAWLDGVFEAP